MWRSRLGADITTSRTQPVDNLSQTSVEILRGFMFIVDMLRMSSSYVIGQFLVKLIQKFLN